MRTFSVKKKLSTPNDTRDFREMEIQLGIKPPVEIKMPGIESPRDSSSISKLNRLKCIRGMAAR